MTTVHFVKKAAKDHPEGGIKKGESYYWWAFMVGGRGGPKRYSKTPPTRSQTTQSEFLAAVYAIEDCLAALTADSALPYAVEEIKGELEELADEQEEKFNNMPDGLQQGESGQLLESRAEACREAANELDGIDFDHDDEKNNPDFWQEKLEEVQQVSINL